MSKLTERMLREIALKLSNGHHVDKDEIVTACSHGEGELRFQRRLLKALSRQQKGSSRG